ncbi:MAG TPA: response regulator [Planctomycetaceae bacterium]|jgi:CheY-like chemotaxis protein/anti-sigma regulatory factor (Ser/Thr protein kinase)|nr:response regulator [Planctomycetaceae bacterium]
MPTVLVVDDSTTDRRLAVGLLEKSPEFTVLQATNGRDALEQIELHLPDLVVTDMMMPEMNGLELVSKVKEHYPLVPIILMTSQGSEEIAVQALQQGASSYVPKRSLATELLEVIDRVLAASQESRGRARLVGRLSRYEYAFNLENDLSLVCAVAGYLREEAIRLRLWPRAECLRLGVALEEALLNAFHHGNLEISSELREQDHRAYNDLAEQRCREAPYKERRIFVSVKVTNTQAIYVVRDEGPGFDPTTLPDPTDPTNLDRPCGRGLLLMRTFMDNVIYNDKGNEVTLFKERGDMSDVELDDE